MKRMSWVLVLMVLAGGCASRARRETGDRVVRRIEKAQGAQAWRSRKGVQYDFTLDMDGKRLVDATVTCTPDLRKCRMVLSDKTILVWDGEKVSSSSPQKTDWERAKFDLRTWPYYFAMPFRLRNLGTNFAETGELRFAGQPYESAKLSFDPGVMFEDDFFILYIDRDSRRISAMAYTAAYQKKFIVEEMTRAVVFDNFETTGGVTLPHRWYFYHWSSLHGIDGPVLGEARVSNFRFIEPAKDAFDKPKIVKERPPVR